MLILCGIPILKKWAESDKPNSTYEYRGKQLEAHHDDICALTYIYVCTLCCPLYALLHIKAGHLFESCGFHTHLQL